MTIQQQMRATLEKSGIPFRQIECYGSQIVVTSQSQETANRWATLLSKFSQVRGVIPSLDERKVEIEPRHGRSLMQHKYVKVWRTFAAV